MCGPSNKSIRRATRNQVGLRGTAYFGFIELITGWATTSRGEASRLLEA